MSANTNTVFLAGNLTADPELRYTPSGTAVCNVRVANNQKWNNAAGEKQEKTIFIRVTVWEKQAEWCGERLRKGDAVLIEGELEQDTWEKDGQKHSTIQIRARRVDVLSPPREGQAAQRDAKPANGAQRPAARSGARF